MHYQYKLFKPNNSEQAKAKINVQDKTNPFHGFIGNEESVDLLLVYAYHSFISKMEIDGEMVSPRSCPARIALIGPPSTGKTTMSKSFADLLKLPFWATSGDNITSPSVITENLEKIFTKSNMELVDDDDEFLSYPPCVIFIDEVHMVPKMVQEQLLPMLEIKDGILTLEDNEKISFRNVCIIIGTTNPEFLTYALKTRFDQINLEKHTKQQLSQIVEAKFPEFTKCVCDMVADVKRTARQALSFSTLVKMVAQKDNSSFPEAINKLIRYEGIQFGMPKKCFKILKLINNSEKGLSKNNICIASGIQVAEFEQDCLPYLLESDRNPAYVEVGARHKITQHGKELLSQL